jgi:sterol desaturase/sphingolipid hydroxylase (fatty acid hydroxylase superfamily)
MTPFAAFYDHPVEFLLMEVIGTFLIPLFVRPLPVHVIAMVWTFQSFSGILDHANAKVPWLLFADSHYHLVHHQVWHRACSFGDHSP